MTDLKVCSRLLSNLCPGSARTIMNLTVWIPAMFLLGLITFGVFFAFLMACEKV
jgi:hypothetical protein